MNDGTEDKESQFKDFIRGGQIFQHSMRMWSQILNKVIIYGGLFFVAMNLIWFAIATTVYQRYVLWHWLIAQFWILVDENHVQLFLQPVGKGYALLNAYSYDVVASPVIDAMLKQIMSHVKNGLVVTTIIQFFVYWGMIVWLRRSGREKTKNTHKSGDRLVDPDTLKKMIVKQKQNSGLSLGSVPIIKSTEGKHFLFDGSTGSGKSSAIKNLLEQIRERGDKAVIYDMDCAIMQEFFVDGDILLNPLDKRGKPWHLWHECDDMSDFHSLASAMIPKNANASEPFWTDAAINLLASTAYKLRDHPGKDVHQLLDVLFSQDDDELIQLLKGTMAATLTSDKVDRMIASVKTILGTYLRGLALVDDKPSAFSIRHWMQDDENKHWLFISSKDNKHSTLRPLISTWLDIAINALLSLNIENNRRVWFILDELPSLHRLPCLTNGLSRARKFGGCFVIGWQSISQAREIYGIEGAKAISSNLNTRLIYNQPEPEVAKWSASCLGEAIRDEVREGFSYGANTMRDGVSLQHTEMNRRLVNASDIMQLKALECFLRLPDGYPITKLKIEYTDRPRLVEAFCPNAMDKSKLTEVDMMPAAKPGSPRAINASQAQLSLGKKIDDIEPLDFGHRLNMMNPQRDLI